jgi:bud site selection protein 31
MSGLRRRLKAKKAPKGWEQIEEAIEDFEQQMAEAVDEDHAGKRKAEMNWKIHRIHWEKNRFIYDLMYVRKAISRELVRFPAPCASKAVQLSTSWHLDGAGPWLWPPRGAMPSRVDACSPLLCRYICSADTSVQFDWLTREKIADGALIAKWRKPGYETLCTLLAIQKGNHNFGTTSHCRVPLKQRAAQQRMTPDVQTGCISCASCAPRHTTLLDAKRIGSLQSAMRKHARDSWQAVPGAAHTQLPRPPTRSMCHTR